jgi:TRAP-type C4-dicarboxylate transport system permease large subunit
VKIPISKSRFNLFLNSRCCGNSVSRAVMALTLPVWIINRKSRNWVDDVLITDVDVLAFRVLTEIVSSERRKRRGRKLWLGASEETGRALEIVGRSRLFEDCLVVRVVAGRVLGLLNLRNKGLVVEVEFRYQKLVGFW